MAKTDTKTQPTLAEETMMQTASPGIDQTTQVANVSSTAVAEQQDLDALMSQFAGEGMERVTQEDLSLPFLYVLQAGSPYVKKSDGRYIEGAGEGDLMNTVTNEIIKGAIEAIPCYFEHVLIEWKPNRGGMVSIYDITNPIRQQAQMKLITTPDGDREMNLLPNGNVLADHMQHYVLYRPLNSDAEWQAAIISMTSSQLKKSRKWNAMMQQPKVLGPNGMKVTPPTYSHVYGLSTVGESQGTKSWMGWKIEALGRVKDVQTFMSARSFYQLVEDAGGKQAPVLDGVDEPAVSTTTATAPSGAPKISDEIPF